MTLKVFKNIWLYIFKAYLSLGLFFYYKKIKVFNVENIPRDKSVLILSNHQNALLDALLIATKSPRYVYFLTRASLFKKPMIKKFLNTLQMLPVYRVRDGWSNLTRNNDIFRTCSNLLVKKEAVVIFPEGSHCLKRTVRPLSKGFTRIVFETIEKYPDTQLMLLPVGLNFEDAKAFKDSVSIYFGEPFLASQFLSNDLNKSIVDLKNHVQNKIGQLTTNIPLEDYDNSLKRLEGYQVDFLKPIQVNQCIANGFVNCPQKSLDNFIIDIILKTLLCVLIAGPYLIWSHYIRPKITEQEFIGTFRFAVAVVLVPVWLLLIVSLLGVYFGWPIAFVYLCFTLCIALLSIKI